MHSAETATLALARVKRAFRRDKQTTAATIFHASAAPTFTPAHLLNLEVFQRLLNVSAIVLIPKV